MKSKLPNLYATVAITVGLSACASSGGYDKWAEETNKKISTGYTELLLGKQTVEIDADVPKEAAINLAYRIGEGVGLPGRSTSAFYNKLMGDVTYPKSCKTSLTFKVAFINKDNALVQTESVFIPSYDAGIKALISKDVMTDPSKQASSQVVKLRVKDFQCLPQVAIASNAVMPTSVKTGQSNAAAFAALTPQQRAAVMGDTPATRIPTTSTAQWTDAVVASAACKSQLWKTVADAMNKKENKIVRDKRNAEENGEVDRGRVNLKTPIPAYGFSIAQFFFTIDASGSDLESPLNGIPSAKRNEALKALGIAANLKQVAPNKLSRNTGNGELTASIGKDGRVYIGCYGYSDF